LESNHDQKSKTDSTKASNEICTTAKEDASEEHRSEEVTQHPAWLLIFIGLIIVSIGAIWLLAPSLPRLGKLPGDI